MRRIIWCSTVCVALLFSASFGAAAAGAQSAGGKHRCRGDYPWSCVQKRVERFIKRRARILGEAQPAVFPSARITARGVSNSCSPQGRRRLVDKWGCSGFISIEEESTVDPPEEYDPEWPIRQSTLRFCRWGYDGAEDLRVRRKRRSGELRLIGRWRMDCALRESEIEQWNTYGPDYQPNVSTPTSYEVIEAPAAALLRPRDDLLPAPSGEPGSAPPGPIDPDTAAQRRASARAASGADYCTNWFWTQYPNGRYAVYVCYSYPNQIPGAALGIFNTLAYYSAYYWAGTDAYGRDVWRFYQSGTTGPPAGMAYP